jgi:hypothetical protein
MDKLKKLHELYNRLPGMKCIPGCTDCCGRAPWSPLEYEQLTDEEKERFHKLTWQCPFAVPGVGCSVHEKRPFICRFFGTTPATVCPREVMPDGFISVEETQELTTYYVRNYFEEMSDDLKSEQSGGKRRPDEVRECKGKGGKGPGEQAA